jgi:hypothetical protein
MRWTFLLVMALQGWACTFGGPPVTAGTGEGGACAGSIDCADGLVCACGACAAPSDPPRPVLCDGLAPDGCPSNPTPCVSSCSAANVVGDATCTDGVERCDSGVLASTCACPSPPPAGWFCDGDVITCFQETSDGLCVVDGCVEEPLNCVEVCGAAERAPQVCVQESPDTTPFRRCRDATNLVDETACGGCVGAPPSCLDDCNILSVVASARCDGDGFVCDVGIIDTACTCEPALPPVCVAADTCADVGLGRASCDLDTSVWGCAVGVRADLCTGGGEGEGEGEGEPQCPGQLEACNGVARVPCWKACDPVDQPLPCGAQCVGGLWSCAGFADYLPADQCP